MKKIQKELLKLHALYDQKYRLEGDRYFEGMCDGLDLAIQEIDKFSFVSLKGATVTQRRGKQ